MKNKIYASLFAVVAVGTVTVSASDNLESLKLPTDWNESLTSRLGRSDSSSQGPSTSDSSLTATLTPRLGSNPGTYAPSIDEIFLRKTAEKLNDLANGVQGLNMIAEKTAQGLKDIAKGSKILNEIAKEFTKIANGLARLRQEDLAAFNKYFGQTDQNEPQAFEVDTEENQDEGND